MPFLTPSLASLLGGCRDPQPPPVDPPPPGTDNVLVILMDDLGQDKVGIYGVHPDPPSTPNIDALAQQGMRFTQAWSFPMCSPTRAALLTGQHTRRYGIGDRLTPNVTSWELVVDEQLTIPQMLESAPVPWDTSFVGKWHLSSGNLGQDPLHHPLLHGFHWSEGSLANLYAAVTNDFPANERDYFLWEEIRNGEVSWKETYATTEVVDDALHRVQRMQEPWFLWVALHSAHDPLHVPPDHLYQGPEPVTDIELVDAMTEAMDAEIGRLLAGLPEEIAARTNIFLLSDNGTPAHGIAPPLDTSRAKGTVYEGGVRIPLIVSGPAVSRPGSVSDALVHVVDLWPTVAELAGVDPAGLQTGTGDPVVLDGQSWLPLLRDSTLPGAETLYTEYFGPNGLGPYTFSAAAVRDAQHKYIRLLDGSEELYALGPEALSEGDNLLLAPDALTPEARKAWDSLSLELDDKLATLVP